MSSFDRGQLILLSRESGTNKVIYEPVNNILRVGSEEEKVDVCLSGLKNVAFSIIIDTFGRVSIVKFTVNNEK